MVCPILTLDRSLNGQEVRLLREILRLTPYALAKSLGVRKSKILCWENGEGTVDPLNDQKLRMLVLDKISPKSLLEIRRQILRNYHNGFKSEEAPSVTTDK